MQGLTEYRVAHVLSLLEQIERVHFQCQVFYGVYACQIGCRIKTLHLGELACAISSYAAKTSSSSRVSARRNPHGKRCMSNNPIRNLFILKSNYMLPTYDYVKLFADRIQVTIELM